MNVRAKTVFCAFAAAGLTAVANAGVVISTIAYDDLSGNFSVTGPGSGIFTALAVNNLQHQSAMTASRLIPVQNDADFFPGFFGNAGAADISITIITNTITNMGFGSFVVTDIDGDTITGDITGEWANVGGIFMAFNGELNNVAFNGMTFNGEAGSSFDMNFAGGPLFDGAIVQLTTAAGGYAGISNSTTGGLLQILPSPGAVALLGLGAFAARRRRA